MGSCLLKYFTVLKNWFVGDPDGFCSVPRTLLHRSTFLWSFWNMEERQISESCSFHFAPILHFTWDARRITVTDDRVIVIAQLLKALQSRYKHWSTDYLCVWGVWSFKNSRFYYARNLKIFQKTFILMKKWPLLRSCWPQARCLNCFNIFLLWDRHISLELFQFVVHLYQLQESEMFLTASNVSPPSSPWFKLWLCFLNGEDEDLL